MNEFLDHCYEYATWWALRLSDQGKLQKQIGKCKLHKKVAEEENTVHTTMMMPSVLLLASTLANMAPHTLDCLDTVSALFTWSWVFNCLFNRTVLKSHGVFNFVHKKFLSAVSKFCCLLQQQKLGIPKIDTRKHLGLQYIHFLSLLCAQYL